MRQPAMPQEVVGVHELVLAFPLILA